MGLATLSKEELWALRSEIVLNSLFVHDYQNSFGISPKSACDFFDGYADFITDLAEEDGLADMPFDKIAERYDNPDNLLAWHQCFDDFSWAEHEET